MLGANFFTMNTAPTCPAVLPVQGRLRVFSILLCLGTVSSCDISSGPQPQVTLHGALFEPMQGGQRISHFDEAHGPRWRVEPPARGIPKLRLINAAGKSPALAVSVETRDGFAIVRTATAALQGDFQAQLSLGNTLLWQGALRWIPKWEGLPQIEAAKALWDLDPDKAEASLRMQTQDPCPWKRYAAYRMWGRLAWSKSSTSAHAILSQGSRDPAMVHVLPDSALMLGESSVFLDGEQGEFARGERQIKYLRSLLPHTRSEFHSANVLLNAGLLFQGRNQRTQGLRLFREAASTAWRSGDDGVWAAAMMLQGGELGLLGRYSEAVTVLQQVRGYAKGARSRSILELNLIWAELWSHEAGLRALKLGTLESRLINLLSDFEEHGAPGDRANVRSCLAYLALRRGDVAEAATWLQDGSSWRPEDLGHERWFIRLVRAELLLKQAKLLEAQAELEQIIAGTRAEVGSMGPHEVLALALLAQVFEARGDTAEAAKFIEKAWRGSLEAARNLDLIGARNHYLHLQRDLPLQLAKARVKAGDVLGAAAVLEETHSERWVQMQAMGVLENRPELWGQVQKARTKLADARTEGCGQVPPKARPGCAHALESKARAARQAEMSFYTQLELPRRANVQEDLRTLQANLSPRQGVLLTAGSGPAQQAYLLTRGAIKAGSSLESLSDQLALIDELAVVGPLDPTTHLSPDGQPWGARLQISRRASATWKPNLPRAQSGPVAVIADPKGDLQTVNVDGRALAKRFGVEAKVVAEATHAAAVQALKAHPRLFVFSGHGQVVDRDHASTKLRFYDRDLEMQDILTDRLSADVVVLNGCSTGSTDHGYGVGLPEAFVLQGSGAVLATIESLPEKDAHRFLTRFFDAGGDKTPGPAFRAAIRASIEAKDHIWKSYRLWR